MGVEVHAEPTGTFTRYLIVDADGETSALCSVAAMIEVHRDGFPEDMAVVAVVDAHLNACPVKVSAPDDTGRCWDITTVEGDMAVEYVEFDGNPDTWRIKAREVYVDGWATPHPAADDY